MNDLFLELPKVENIRIKFKDLYQKNLFITNKNKTGSTTVEIINACFIADEDTIFGEINHEYIKRELDWYKSMSLRVSEIPPPIPKIWESVASKDGLINSNYGYLIYHPANYSQYENCKKSLIEDDGTRRAIMIYTRPNIQYDFNKNGMADFICTNTVQYFIRNNELISCVAMRSNDAIFGYRNDFHWQHYVHKQLLNDLNDVYPNLKLGPMIWQAGSLHIYERHFNLIK